MEKSALPAYPIEKPENKVSAHWMNNKGTAVVHPLMAIFFGFLPTVDIISTLDYTWVKVIQIVVFVSLGCLNAIMVEKHFSFEKQFSGKVIFTSILSLSIFCILSGVYFFKESGTVLLACASSAAFALPFIIDQNWKSFQFTLPKGSSKPWYNKQITTREKVSVFLTGIPLQIALPVKTEDRQKRIFTSLAPTDMKLGEFFDYFLLLRNNNERQNIEIYDHKQKPFGWEFYEAKMGGFKKRRLDPEANLMDNNIRRNTTIIVERVLDEYQIGSN